MLPIFFSKPYKERDNMDSINTVDPQCCMRQSIGELLKTRARGLRDRAHSMEILADEIQMRSFSSEADNMLWGLLVEGSRNL